MGSQKREHTCAITSMRNQMFRAECLIVTDGFDCGWWFDTHYGDLAEQALHQHMAQAHDMRRINVKADR